MTNELNTILKIQLHTIISNHGKEQCGSELYSFCGEREQEENVSASLPHSILGYYGGY